MPRHKLAGNLRRADVFEMAGVHYFILDTRESDIAGWVDIDFTPNGPNEQRRKMTMQMPVAQLFLLIN